VERLTAVLVQRKTIAVELLDKDLTDRIVHAHLDLYLPVQNANAVETLVTRTVPSLGVIGTPPPLPPDVVDIRNGPDTTII
jgi:hypothetical protein